MYRLKCLQYSLKIKSVYNIKMLKYITVKISCTYIIRMWGCDTKKKERKQILKIQVQTTVAEIDARDLLIILANTR